MIGMCPLASGSRGNSIYIGTEKTKILVDAGISLKDLTARLAQIQVDIKDIDAVLITHEHIDHIRGLAVLCKKWNTPIFANRETAAMIAQEASFLPRFNKSRKKRSLLSDHCSCFSICKNRRVPFFAQNSKSSYMIDMFMRDQHSIDIFYIHLNLCQTSC